MSPARGAQARRGRHGGHATDALEQRSLRVAGAQRSYWLAAAADRSAPLLVALHGSGMSGKAMAAFTGLGLLGPAAGFTVVFPEARKQAWYCGSSPERRAALDDDGFIAALVEHHLAGGERRAERVALAGISNGAFFAERLARDRVVPVDTLALVAGTALEWSREATPRPAQPASVVCFAGTADPLVPYEGGALGTGGAFGWWVRRVRRRRRWFEPGEGRAVGAEALARDWAEANGCDGDPGSEPVAGLSGALETRRLTWSAPGAHPVVVYRIEGGGHGWPGGPQYLPSRLIGSVARHLDASALVLAAATHAR